MYTQLSVLPLKRCVFSVNHRRVSPPPAMFLFFPEERWDGAGVSKNSKLGCVFIWFVFIPTNGKGSKLTSTFFSNGLFNQQLEKTGLVVLHGLNIRWRLFPAE